MKKRLLFSIVIVSLLIFSLPVSVLAEQRNGIVILYENDVHCEIEGYSVLSAMRNELKQEYEHVGIVTSGDYLQGGSLGSISRGEYVVRLMNLVGYDAIALGNHEFDYGMFGCMQVIDWAQFPYTSCNFYNEAAGVRGESVLDAYVTFECGDEKIAFVGITTPETFTKSTPAYFQNENGEYIYGIAGGEDGAA